MKKTIALLLTICMLMSVALIGCGSKKTNESTGPSTATAGAEKAKFETKDVKNLSIATSMITGTFYIMATPLAELISSMDGYSAIPEASDGSAANIQMIENEEVYMAITSTLTAYQGYEGLGFAEAQKTKYTSQRALFMTHSSYWQNITIPETGIKYFSDFEGKNIDVTAPGGTPYVAFYDFMDALGVHPKNIVNSTFAASVDALKDKRIDNAVAVTGVPYSSIYDFASSNKMVMQDFTQEEVDKIVAKYPYYAPATIPAGTYPGQDSEIKTFEFWNMCICSKLLTDQFVYDLLDLVYSNTDMFKNAYAGAKIDKDAIVNANIPLHAGAVRWYTEHGVTIPENLIPEEYQG